MNKCPLNNFQDCKNDCAWYLKDNQCCAILKLSKLSSINNLVELKAIQRDIASIESKIKYLPE